MTTSHDGRMYVFCINTGRAGSHYLSEILAHAEGCRSVHEARPKLNGKPMRAFLHGREGALRALMPEKLEAIEAERGGLPVYAETNHCFIKGFGWLLPASIPEEKLTVLVLRRKTEKVIDSYLRIDCSPASRCGQKWLIPPTATPIHGESPGLVLKAKYYLARAAFLGVLRGRIWGRFGYYDPPRPAFLHRWERSLTEWYVNEVYARVEAFRREFPGVRIIEVELEALNSLSAAKDLLREIGLRPLDSLRDVVGRKTNLKRPA